MPASRLKKELSRILAEQGYITGYEVEPTAVGEVIRIQLKYTEDRRPVISGMRRVSRPGRRRYVAHDEVPRVQGGMGTAIVSTSSGVMTGHEAKREGRRRRGRRLRVVNSSMSRIGKKPITVPEGVTVEPRPWPRDRQRPQGRARAERLDRGWRSSRTTTASSPSAGRPTAATTAPSTGSPAAWSRTWSRASPTGSRSGSRSRASATARSSPGKALELSVGYSHPVTIQAPDGIEFEVPQPTQIIVRGIDKQLVGEIAAQIRRVRPPEPYKGKGIRYAGEQVRRKVGKRA